MPALSAAHSRYRDSACPPKPQAHPHLFTPVEHRWPLPRGGPSWSMPPNLAARLTLSSLQSSAKFGGGASTASTPSKLEASATSAKFRPVPLLIGGATFIGRVRQLFGSPPGSRSPSGSDDPRRAAAASRRTRTSADDGASRAVPIDRPTRAYLCHRVVARANSVSAAFSPAMHRCACGAAVSTFSIDQRGT